MSAPGFTATASLYPSTGCYRGGGGFGQAPAQRVVAQEVLHNCYTRQYCIPPVWLCQDVCWTLNNEPVYSDFYHCGWCLLGIPFTDWGLGWFS